MLDMEGSYVVVRRAEFVRLAEQRLRRWRDSAEYGASSASTGGPKAVMFAARFAL